MNKICVNYLIVYILLIYSSLLFSEQVRVKIYDHRAEHDPNEMYGSGPWKYMGYGWGIEYQYEPDGTYQREKGYGFMKMFARDFCKFKDGRKCRPSDPKFFDKLYEQNRGEPYWGHPSPDIKKEHNEAAKDIHKFHHNNLEESHHQNGDDDEHDNNNDDDDDSNSKRKNTIIHIPFVNDKLNYPNQLPPANELDNYYHHTNDDEVDSDDGEYSLNNHNSHHLSKLNSRPYKSNVHDSQNKDNNKSNRFEDEKNNGKNHKNILLHHHHHHYYYYHPPPSSTSSPITTSSDHSNRSLQPNNNSYKKDNYIEIHNQQNNGHYNDRSQSDYKNYGSNEIDDHEDNHLTIDHEPLVKNIDDRLSSDHHYLHDQTYTNREESMNDADNDNNFENNKDNYERRSYHRENNNNNSNKVSYNLPKIFYMNNKNIDNNNYYNDDYNNYKYNKNNNNHINNNNININNVNGYADTSIDVVNENNNRSYSRSYNNENNYEASGAATIDGNFEDDDGIPVYYDDPHKRKIKRSKSY